MKTENTPPARLQWFLDRIGKTVYRNKTSCKCDSCADVHENGLRVGDVMHAEYLCEIEGVSNYEGVPLGYFDTIEERDEFEQSLPVVPDEEKVNDARVKALKLKK